MEINDWTNSLKKLYTVALEKYAAGQRGADTYFSKDETAFLASIGLKPINLYDYAEDFTGRGEPDWETALLMISARRGYFRHEMRREWTATPIQQSDLPSKTDALDGIEWLPRIIVKADAYLRGALPEEIMYCCSGDRNFLKAHKLHPADFLRVVWSAKGDKNKIVSYVRNAEV